MIEVLPVILAGGSGSRLWPLSRSEHPKQFLALDTGGQSLYQQALLRTSGLAGADHFALPPLTVGNEAHRFLLIEQARDALGDPGSVLLEPLARNTAPALTMAALQAREHGSDPVMVVAAADHAIADEPRFARALEQAVREATTGAIAILGIKPTRAETGYGYVRCEGLDRLHVKVVQQFVEKPDARLAQRYFEDGLHYWNSGLFVLRASTWLRAIDRFRPETALACAAAFDARTFDGRFIRPDRDLFSGISAESIDYAVMEPSSGSDNGVVMVPLDAGWDDLGAWGAVWQRAGKDNRGNAIVGDAIVHQADNCLVHASHRLVGLVGLRDVVVVETADAVLVADRACSQDVKLIVASLEEAGRLESTLHRKVHRPWGWYDSLESGERFQVKRIMVNPGSSLSLQLHHHRAEHWIVIRGTADVTNGEELLTLKENEGTYIPVGRKHRLANTGQVPLEIIEVQSGSYLGEDDIVRFEDHYGRC